MKFFREEFLYLEGRILWDFFKRKKNPNKKKPNFNHEAHEGKE